MQPDGNLVLYPVTSEVLELCALKNNTMHFYLIIKFYFHIHNYYCLNVACDVTFVGKIMLMVKEPKTGSNDFS